MRRRDFVKLSGATALLSGMPSGVFGVATGLRQGKIITGRKLNIACIGAGGRGEAAVQAMRGENIVALCDVDAKQAATSFAAHTNVPHYTDYRKMLKEMDGEIDAVTVSTPDHTHFPAAMMAVKQGKHVFVEKPMAHTVEEARLLRLAVKKHNVISQMGNQGHAKEGIRLVKEWIDAGVIGDIHQVDIWTNRPIWPQGMTAQPPAMPVPGTIDWNLWLGVAPKRPYNSNYLPFKWRGWWDFGTGAFGDMGCHIMDAPFWALKLENPTSITAETSPVSNESPPKWSIVTYKFPARGKMPPITMTWYDGKKKPPRPASLEEGRSVPAQGVYYHGTKKTLASFSAYCNSPRLIPESDMREFAPNRPEETIPRVKGGHFAEWIRACKGEGPMPGSNFEYAGPLTETILLGNIAIRAGRKIRWDSKKLECIGDPESTRLVSKKYRKF